MRRQPLLINVLLCILTALVAGCAGFHLPKTITDGDVTPRRKKRNEEITQHFEKQRDFAEYEAAKTRWVQQRDPKGCREALEKLLARKPEHREARLLMVELLLDQDDSQTAYRHAKAALDAFPNDAQVQYTVALTLDAQNKNADALAYYERAAKMDPQNETFAIAYRTAREASREESRHAKAPTPDADSLAELTAECVAVGYMAPTVPLPPSTAPAGLRDAIDRVDSAGVADDKRAGELLRRGRAALAEGSPQAALDHFRQADAAQPDNPQIPISAAAELLRANRPKQAIELLTPAAKRPSSSAAVHRMLGVAYYRTGDYKSSQVALQQALSLDKSSALSYLLLGCTLAKLGQGEAAEAHFRQARTLDPKYRAVR